MPDPSIRLDDQHIVADARKEALQIAQARNAAKNADTLLAEAKKFSEFLLTGKIEQSDAS